MTSHTGPRPHYSPKALVGRSQEFPISTRADLPAPELAPNLANVIKHPVIKPRVFT